MPLRLRPSGSFVLAVQLTLMPGRDDDLLVALAQVPKGSLAGVLREMLRNGVQVAVHTLAESGLEPEPDMNSLGFEL